MDELTVPSFLKDAIEHLIEDTRKHAVVNKNVEVIDLHKVASGVERIIRVPGEPSKREFFANDCRGRNHTFTTLEGFCDFLNGPHCVDNHDGEGVGVVFVQREDAKLAHADLDYLGNGKPESAVLSLQRSTEYKALEKLATGIGQASLWRLLFTDLEGCIEPDNLITYILDMDVKLEDGKQVKISPLGPSAVRSSSAVSIKYPNSEGGMETREMPVEWKWSGRIWEGFDYSCEVDLRMELSASREGDVIFKFHPKRLAEHNNNARLALVAALRQRVTGPFNVYEGLY
ncbi:MAG: hypothetical protein AMXMBFR84_37560 [Candidatus Hydrogenedentota bacterium]